MQNADNAQSQKQLKLLAISMLVVSFLGFLDATYLTINHYTGATLPCSITHGCEIVTQSEYSEFLGIPVALFGVLFYLTIFLGSYFFLEYRSKLYFKITAAMTVFGVLFSAWFVYVQLGILHAICQYCMLSAITSTVLFVLGIAVVKISSPSQSPSVTDQE
jgi:uncharacterized membrane protein